MYLHSRSLPWIWDSRWSHIYFDKDPQYSTYLQVLPLANWSLSSHNTLWYCRTEGVLQTSQASSLDPDPQSRCQYVRRIFPHLALTNHAALIRTSAPPVSLRHLSRLRIHRMPVRQTRSLLSFWTPGSQSCVQARFQRRLRSNLHSGMLCSAILFRVSLSRLDRR